MLSNLKILPSGVGGASCSEKCHVFACCACFQSFGCKTIAKCFYFRTRKNKKNICAQGTNFEDRPAETPGFFAPVHVFKILVAKPLQSAYIFAYAKTKKIFGFKGQILKTDRSNASKCSMLCHCAFCTRVGRQNHCKMLILAHMQNETKYL